MKQRAKLTILGFYSILIIPVGTLYLASRQSLFTNNISDIGNEFGYTVEYFIWGIGVSCFFLYVIGYFIKKYTTNKYLKYSLWIGVVALIGSVLVPYFPEQNLFLANRHVDLAFLGLTILITTYIVLLANLKVQGYPYIDVKIGVFVTILLVILSLFFHFQMINGLIQLVFVSLYSIYLFSLYYLDRRVAYKPK